MAASHEGSLPRFKHPAESTHESVWMHNAEMHGREQTYTTNFPRLEEDVTTDIAIVGAGITGITTAILLQNAGYNVAVIDAHPVGYGVSGFNSGHLTTMLLDMQFKNIISDFGEEATRSIARGLGKAVDLIERLVRDYRIDCNFKRVSGYLYTEKSSQVRALQEEYEAAAKAGLQVNRTHNVPLPFSVEDGLHVANQAIFNPLKYVQALALQFAKQGGRIYENSRVTNLDHVVKAGEFDLETDDGVMTTREVILATHTPIGFRPAIQTRLEPYRSYIIGVRTDDVFADSLFWDMEDPYHYIRMAHDEKGPLVIVGGEDHKTGEMHHTEHCFRKLENFAIEHFNVKSVDYRWSAQLYNPVDGLPYIGKLSGVYIATGYSGEGLAFGTLAAQMMTDQIVGLQNDCSDILTPGRAKPIASAGSFFSENMGAASHFVMDRLAKPEVSEPSQVSIGEGALCSIKGQKTAVYRDDAGTLHYLSPVCTHMNCIVQWNSAEKSWDCPCHGGRFSAIGDVLNGPPVLALKPINPDR